MSTYGGSIDGFRFAQGILQPTGGLIDIRGEGPEHWLVTLAPLRTKQGRPLTVQGNVTYLAQFSMGHGSVEAPGTVDWPIAGGTFCVCASSLRVTGSLEGQAVIGLGDVTLDVHLVAWAAPQSGPRQTIWPPVRSVNYGNLTAATPLRIAVPPWARGYTIQAGTAAGGGAVHARHFDSSPVAIQVRTDVWSATVPAVLPGVWLGLIQGGGQNPIRRIMLPPNVANLELEAASDLNNVRVVFDLDLG